MAEKSDFKNPSQVDRHVWRYFEEIKQARGYLEHISTELLELAYRISDERNAKIQELALKHRYFGSKVSEKADTLALIARNIVRVDEDCQKRTEGVFREIKAQETECERLVNEAERAIIKIRLAEKSGEPDSQ